MAGILNSKERLIDFIVTDQGRNQLSDGRMIVEFASFTDRHTFYEMSGSDHPDVAEDASNRIFFEATDRHQDIIVPEIRAGSFMQSFRAGDFNIEGRRIASGTFRLTAAVSETSALTGSDVNRATLPFLQALVTNFKDHMILETEDLFSDTSDFALTAHTASFVLTDNNLDFVDTTQTSPVPPSQTVDLNSWPSIYRNDRFNHLCNFNFMPPINVKEKPDDPDVPLGLYPNFDADSERSTFVGINSVGQGIYSSPSNKIDVPGQVLQNRFSNKTSIKNYLDGKQSVSFTFKDTSNANNFIAQIFEINGSPVGTAQPIEKLSIIDFGEFNDDDPNSSPFHVYFVGKLRKDFFNAHTYLNLFTIVIDNPTE